MPSKYGNMSISTFLNQLSSAAPAPGGGSVAALSGAMAAALILMVCNLTIGKEKFARSEQEIKEIKQQATELRHTLVDAVDADINAYNRVIACYRLPKASKQERVDRRESLQQALKKATEVPYHTAEACYRVLELNRKLPGIGNPSAVSDVAVSVRLAEAGLQSALYNVDINCNYIKDEVYTKKYRAGRVKLAEKARLMRKEIICTVRTMLQG